MTVTKESYAMHAADNIGRMRPKAFLDPYHKHESVPKKLSKYAIRKNTKRARKAAQ